MRILFITNLFQPEPNHLKGYNFLKSLIARGHEVRVLTGFPNYPGGAIYPGYRIRWTQEELMEGLRVTRVAMYPSHDRSSIRRSFNYLSLGVSMLMHLPRLREKYDVCYVYLGPITLLWPALWLKWRYGTRFVADVQDIWPESVTDSGMLRSKLLLKLINVISNWSYAKSDRIIVLSPGYKNTLVERGYPAAHIDVVYNWAEERNNSCIEESVEEYIDSTCFNIIYAGNMGKLQGLDTVLDAMKLVDAKGSKSRIVLVGDGVEYDRLLLRIQKEKITNAAIFPRVSAAQARAIQKKADILLVHLERTPLTKMGIPQKIQAYMASGKPILAAVEGEGARLVKEAGCGLTCYPSDPVLLAETILQAEALPINVRNEMGRCGHDFYAKRMSYDIGIEKIDHLICHVLKQ